MGTIDLHGAHINPQIRTGQEIENWKQGLKVILWGVEEGELWCFFYPYCWKYYMGPHSSPLTPSRPPPAERGVLGTLYTLWQYILTQTLDHPLPVWISLSLSQWMTLSFNPFMNHRLLGNFDTPSHQSTPTHFQSITKPCWFHLLNISIHPLLHHHTSPVTIVYLDCRIISYTYPLIQSGTNPK